MQTQIASNTVILIICQLFIHSILIRMLYDFVKWFMKFQNHNLQNQNIAMVEDSNNLAVAETDTNNLLE